MTCTENPKKHTDQSEPVKKITRCPECGSEEISNGSRDAPDGSLEVAWTICDDCGHLIDVG